MDAFEIFGRAIKSKIQLLLRTTWCHENMEMCLSSLIFSIFWYMAWWPNALRLYSGYWICKILWVRIPQHSTFFSFIFAFSLFHVLLQICRFSLFFILVLFTLLSKGRRKNRVVTMVKFFQKSSIKKSSLFLKCNIHYVRYWMPFKLI